MNLFAPSPAVTAALHQGRPVVALESAVITHGLPRPLNLEIARKLEAVVRDEGAEPATVAVMDGRVRVGLDEESLERLATEENPLKVSWRDMASATASGRDGGTTVAATLLAAANTGIAVFATGGIGGVHRGADKSFDISADLMALAQTPVAVVCAGAKSILDLAKTLEVLETQGVPVVGFGTNRFPAFHSIDSGLGLEAQVETAQEAARLIETQRALGLENGIVFANPIPDQHAIPAAEIEAWTLQSIADAEAEGISGKATTPFLLARLADLSNGRTLKANIALLKNNARVAAHIAAALTLPAAVSRFERRRKVL